MSEIQAISLERLNNGAHFLFISNVLARAEADTKVASKVGSQLAALRAAKEQEDIDLKISNKSLLTDDIKAADQERDALYASYKKSVQGFLGLPVETMAKAAKVLNQHIKDYGIDPKMQLDKQTGLLINFIQDLESKYVNEISTLSLGAFVTALKASNEKVRALTSERTDERMTKNVGALKASRSASDDAYRLMVKFVNAYALIEGDKDYVSFIDYVNTEIVHYKREVMGMKVSAAQVSGNAAPSVSEGSGSGAGNGSSADSGSTSGGSGSASGGNTVPAGSVTISKISNKADGGSISVPSNAEFEVIGSGIDTLTAQNFVMSCGTVGTFTVRNSTIGTLSFASVALPSGQQTLKVMVGGKCLFTLNVEVENMIEF